MNKVALCVVVSVASISNCAIPLAMVFASTDTDVDASRSATASSANSTAVTDIVAADCKFADDCLIFVADAEISASIDRLACAVSTALAVTVAVTGNVAVDTAVLTALAVTVPDEINNADDIPTSPAVTSIVTFDDKVADADLMAFAVAETVALLDTLAEAGLIAPAVAETVPDMARLLSPVCTEVALTVTVAEEMVKTVARSRSCACVPCVT